MTLTGQAILLAVFSLVLGAVVSCYRDDETQVILKGTFRRALLFFVAVTLLGVLALVLESTFLRPGS